MIRRSALLFLMSLLGASLSGLWYGPAIIWREPPVTGALSLAEARQLAAQEPLLWLDARSKAAYQRAHLPNALWLSEDAWQSGLDRFLQAWEPGRAVIVYCDQRGCRASDRVATRLRKETGFARIHVLQDDWHPWSAP